MEMIPGDGVTRKWVCICDRYRDNAERDDVGLLPAETQDAAISDYASTKTISIEFSKRRTGKIKTSTGPSNTHKNKICILLHKTPTQTQQLVRSVNEHYTIS